MPLRWYNVVLVIEWFRNAPSRAVEIVCQLSTKLDTLDRESRTSGSQESKISRKSKNIGDVFSIVTAIGLASFRFSSLGDCPGGTVRFALADLEFQGRLGSGLCR